MTTPKRLLLLLLLCCSTSVMALGQSPSRGTPATPAASQDAASASGAESQDGSEVLLRTNSGELIPLTPLLGKEVIGELLKSVQEQRSVPRYTIAQMELTGVIDGDVIRLNVELQIQVRPETEWVTVPLAFGDVFVTKFSSTSDAKAGQALLTTGEQNSREWHLSGKGLHTVRMELVGKTRVVTPGVTQLNLILPTATASHAMFSFAAPVELQKLPAGSVDRVTSDDQGVRSVEFWGLAAGFGLTWSEVVPRVVRKPVIQVQNRMKLDLTTIPVNLTGTQVLQISGSPISEIRVTFPDGFQLQEVDARNASGVSVLNTFEITSTSGPVAALIRLTSAMEGMLTLSFELELANRQFPQDIRVAIPSILDANVQSGDLDLLFPTGLLVQQTSLKDVQRKRVTSETDPSVAATAFRMRSPDSQIVLHVEETEAQFAVNPEMIVQPDEQNVILVVKYPVSVLKGSLLDFSIYWPGYSRGEWQVLPGSLQLISDKTNVPLLYEQSEADLDVLQMTFPERQSGEFSVEFRAFAALAAVQSGAVQLRCPEVQSRQGQSFVLTTIESDEYSIRPISMGTGELLSTVPFSTPSAATQVGPGLKSERWLHDDPSIPIRLELPAQAPSVRARIMVGMQPRENGIEVRETIRFEIEHRDLASLSLQVPNGIRPTVRISGQSEALRATIESSNWSFPLPESRRGSLSVDVTYLWTAPMETAQSIEHIYQLPVILPQSTEVLGVEAGAGSLSGLKVSDEANWRPVYSDQFELAWQTTQPVASVPLKWQDRLSVSSSRSPELVLARTQIIGTQAITTTLAVYEIVPTFIIVETPEAIEVEAILLGSQSLTSSDVGRTMMRTDRIADRKAIRWSIDSRFLPATQSGPVLLEFRVRQRIPPQAALWKNSTFHRAVVVGESSAVPVVWCFGSQDEFQAASASSAFSSLTQRTATVLPGGETVRTVADRQFEAILSPYPTAVQVKMAERMDDWLSQSGRQDVFFGSADSGALKLTLVPGVALLLGSAAVCVVAFLLMSIFRQLTLPILMLFLTSVVLVAWLIWPEWTLMFAPYVAMGIVVALVSTILQRMMSERRPVFAGSSRAGEFPSVFGFSGVLTSPLVERLETVTLDESRKSDFSVGSAK